MKKFEAKTVLLLMLPALALLGFASLLSLRSKTHDAGAPYVITKHRIVMGFSALTVAQRETAKVAKLNPQNCVLYQIEVESHKASWFENWVLGNSDSPADLSGTACIEIKSGIGFAPTFSGGGNTLKEGKFISCTEDLYDLNELKNAEGKIEFSVPLSWRRDGHDFSRMLTKKILPANLKEGIQ